MPSAGWIYRAVVAQKTMVAPPIFLSPFFSAKACVVCVCFFSRVCYAFHKCGGGDAFLPPRRKGRSFIQTISNLDIVLLP